MGSPPPAGSKKVVLKFLSVNNIVMAPASTGKLNNRRNAVINTDHTNKGSLCIDKPGLRILKIVAYSKMLLNFVCTINCKASYSCLSNMKILYTLLLCLFHICSLCGSCFLWIFGLQVGVINFNSLRTFQKHLLGER